MDYYEVEASADGVIWTTLASSVVETTYTHERLRAGNTCHYRVFAHNAEGRSPASAVASGATEGAPSQPCALTEPARPEGPGGLEATAEGETAIALTWTGPALLYGEPVDYYEVEVSEDGEYWQTLAPRVDEAAYTHQGLEAGDTRRYRVYAHSEVGRGPASAVVCGTTDGALGKPCILDVAVDGATVTVSWAKARGADGYLITLMDLADYSYEEYYVEDLPADAQTYTYTGVQAAKYLAIVVAYTGNADDFSDYSYDGVNLEVK